MAVRIRSRFHRKRAHAMAEIASAVAVLGWKLSQQAIRRMREAQFDIDIGRPYFDFVCEYLAFVLHVADRVAWRRLESGRREEFARALALRLAEIVEENRAMLCGPVEVGRCRRDFIDLANRRGADYAEFGYDDKDGPDFGFRRFFASALAEILPAKDRVWVADQAMEIEAPDAVAAIERTLAGLLTPAER